MSLADDSFPFWKHFAKDVVHYLNHVNKVHIHKYACKMKALYLTCTFYTTKMREKHVKILVCLYAYDEYTIKHNKPFIRIHQLGLLAESFKLRRVATAQTFHFIRQQLISFSRFVHSIKKGLLKTHVWLWYREPHDSFTICLTPSNMVSKWFL